MYKFIIPSNMRNAALTELPMMPPTMLNELNFLETVAAVAATTMEVIITMLQMMLIFSYTMNYEKYPFSTVHLTSNDLMKRRSQR